MMITLPCEFDCSLETKEIETIKNCTKLLHEMVNQIDACECEFFHTSWGEDIGSGEIEDMIKRLTEFIYIDKMF